jgi:alpha-glucosidase (family GH31 glycosyl hydrolase)
MALFFDDKIFKAINKDGTVVFKEQKAGFKERAFLCFYLLQKGDESTAAVVLNKMTAEMLTVRSGYNDALFWLWAFGEYLKAIDDTTSVKIYSDVIDYCISIIAHNWNRPGPHWLYPEEAGIFLSNIAMAYGSLSSIGNCIDGESIQKLLIDIRAFVFEKFIKKGRITSRLGNNEVCGDITAAAVPFGLLGIEDRILVEAVNELEEGLINRGVRFSSDDMYFGGCARTDITSILSWYYSEKGEMAKAKQLLGYVEQLWNEAHELYDIIPNTYAEEIYYKYYLEQYNGSFKENYLSYVLYSIAQQSIDSNQHFAIADSSALMRFIHYPTGWDDPYFFENNERVPRYPEVGQEIILKMVTQPFEAEMRPFVELYLNGQLQPKVSMSLITSPDGERYWQAEIGSFYFGDDVVYKFVVDENDMYVQSTEYSFSVRRWQPLNRVLGTEITDEGINIAFLPLQNNDKMPYLQLTTRDDNTAKLSFETKKADNYVENKQTETENYAHIKFGDNILKFFPNDVCISINKENGSLLKSYNNHDIPFIEALTDKGGIIHKLRFNFAMTADEKIFGMGERYSHFNYRSEDVDNYVYNQYRDQGLKTYLPVPLAISSRGYGLYMDTYLYSIFRFATQLSDLLQVEVDINEDKQVLDFYIFIGQPKEIIEQFTDIIGKPKLPPKWTFGLWMSSNNWDSQSEVCNQLALTKKYRIPATVIVLEQWSDEATFYIFNDAQYNVKSGDSYLEYDDFTFPEWGRWPNPKQMVEDIHGEGLRILLWQIPVMKYMSGIAHPQRDEDEKAMLDNGCHVKLSDGKPYRIPYGWFNESLILDFTNPKAREWWFKKREYLVKDIGVDGFKTDGGECVFGRDTMFFDGSSGNEMRNKYPNEYIKAYNEFLASYLTDYITFSRAGYTGAQIFPAHWAGDERSTYKAFRASVIAGLSCSMSGIPFWGWDLAGFHGDIPTADLYLRASQMAAFCPIMQYHAETKGEFNQDRTPWNIAERTGEPRVIEIFKKYADLRMNLLPYIYNEAIKASNTGIPIMRAMFVEYPNDESCADLKEQYMFGDCLLVAPVMQEETYEKKVYLPSGQWMDLLNGAEFLGSKFMTVKAPIDYIPVYVKADSIIPLNLGDSLDLCSDVGNAIDSYKNLCFLAYVKDTAMLNFVDDLGNEIHISCNKKPEGVAIDVKSFCKYPFIIMLKNAGRVGNIELSGTVCNCFAKGDDLIIKTKE